MRSHILMLTAAGAVLSATHFTQAAALPALADQFIQANESWIAGTANNRASDDHFNGGVLRTIMPASPYLKVAVTHVGFLDQGLDGLSASHDVSLWKMSGQSQALLVNVPAGTAAPLQNGYRWVELLTPIILESDTDYVLGGQTNGDTWKDPAPTGASTYGFTSTYTRAYGSPHFSPWIRYGTTTSGMPNGSASWGWNRHYGAGNLAFSVIPEPTSVTALAAAGLVLRRRRA